MKKKYESPLAEVLEFDLKDIMMAYSNPETEEKETEKETEEGEEDES